MINEGLEILKESVLETIWPTRCAVCDKHGNYLCKDCIRKLQIIDNLKSCQICGEPYGKNQCCSCTPIDNRDKTTDSKIKYFDNALSFCVLDQYSGRIITLYKDSGDRGISTLIAYFLSKIIPKEWTQSNEIILSYIPSTKEAKLKRGFDHCELIVNKLSSITNISYKSLFNVEKVDDQRNLSRSDRNKNTEDKFSLTKSFNSIKTPDKTTIILIDGVFTTGSTLNAASKILKENNIKTIKCLTFCRTF